MHLFAGMYVEMIGLGYSRQPRQQGAEMNFILFILARRQMGADASAVAFHDGFGDGKPDAVAAACPCAGIVRSVKTVEQARNLIGLQVLTGVLHLETEEAFFLVQGHSDRAVRQAIFDCVIQQN